MAVTDLVDYVAGDLPDTDAASLEDHLFTCGECASRAGELDALLHAIPGAVRSAQVSGFVTDEVLNRLARDGVRIRTFTLSPGAIVPCAVWDDDELMVLRMRGDVGGASEFTMTQRTAGGEVTRVTGHLTPASGAEVLYVVPAAWVREMPVVDVEVRLTTQDAGGERTIGSYTLRHGGALER